MSPNSSASTTAAAAAAAAAASSPMTTEEESARFRVVIVGGGPGGLMMAHMLERAGIDWVVLERRASGAGVEGAAVAFWPHSCRILDQLGLLDEAEAMHMPLRDKYNIRRDGSLVSKSNMMERIGHNHGYGFWLIDRQELLDFLRRRLPNQEKQVLVNKTVVAIESTPGGGVRVDCHDGTSVRGSMVVGCDGVRSTVRRLMADPVTFPEPQQPQGTTKTKTNKARSEAVARKAKEADMKATYMGLVGHCPRPEDLPPQTVWEERETGLSVTVMAGDNDLYFFVYKLRSHWLALKKTAAAAVAKERKEEGMRDETNGLETSAGASEGANGANELWSSYTERDMDMLAAHVGDVPVMEGGAMRFADLWAARTRASMLDFEEGVASCWHRGRMVLASDAAVKMTPNAAFGLNTGIQGMVELTNRLWRLLRQDGPDPGEDRLAKEVFAPYQAARWAPALFTYHFSRMYTRTVTWANLAWRLLDMASPYLGGDGGMLDWVVSPVVRRAVVLDFVSESDHRSGKMPWRVAKVMELTATATATAGRT